MKWSALYTLFLVLFLQSCSHYNQVNYTSGTTFINNPVDADSSLISIIEPYKNILSAEINEVIGYSATDMKRAKPESTLGNFVADALLQEGRASSADPVDFAVHNYGGLRIDYLNAGPVTKGKIFELLPFENFAVVVLSDGQTTARLIQKIVEEGGWPVAGISFSIQNGQAVQILINAEPFDTSKVYRVIMNDYMANGGDNMDFLKGKEVAFTGKTVRDMILEYIEKENSLNRKINSTLDGRITYAE